MTKEKKVGSSIQDARMFTSPASAWAKATPEKVASVFSVDSNRSLIDFQREWMLFPTLVKQKVFPKDLLIVTKDNIWDDVKRFYFKKGKKPETFDLSARASFRKTQQGHWVPSLLSDGKDEETINLGPLFGDRFARKITKNFSLAISTNYILGGYLSNIEGIHGKGKKNDERFSFCSGLKTDKPIGGSLNYDRKTIKTGANSVEAIYQGTVVVLKVFQNGEFVGDVTIPTFFDHKKIVGKLLPKVNFENPFEALPETDASWKGVDLMKAIGIKWNLMDNKKTNQSSSNPTSPK